MSYKRLLFMLLFLPVFVTGQVPCRDDECYRIVKPENYKISRREFIAKYSNGNDTAVALIHFFFAKRRNAILKIVVPVVVSGAAGVLAVNAFKKAGSAADTTAAFGYSLPALSLVLFPPGGINDLREYNRENLLFTLIDLQRRNGLADRYSGNLEKYYPGK